MDTFLAKSLHTYFIFLDYVSERRISGSGGRMITESFCSTRFYLQGNRCPLAVRPQGTRAFLSPPDPPPVLLTLTFFTCADTVWDVGTPEPPVVTGSCIK